MGKVPGTVDGHQTGRVGTLVPKPEVVKNWNQIQDEEERQKAWEDYRDHLESEVGRFNALYPQIVSAGEVGEQNGKIIRAWLQARGVDPELANIQAALQDFYRKLIFDPSAAGRPELGKQATGMEYESKLDAEQFLWLLTPHAPCSKPDPYEPQQSAAEFKRKHPEGWEHERKQVQDMEVRYVEEQVKKFMELAPAYDPTPTNRTTLLAAVEASGLRITQASLLEVFNRLVDAGRMKKNESVDLKVGVTRRVDLA
jgi:hypothetical protein